MANYRKLVRDDEMARYRLWEGRLQNVMALCVAAQNAGHIRRRDINLDLKTACADLDKLVVPQGWNSWEHLGKAVDRVSRDIGNKG